MWILLYSLISLALSGLFYRSVSTSPTWLEPPGRTIVISGLVGLLWPISSSTFLLLAVTDLWSSRPRPPKEGFQYQ